MPKRSPEHLERRREQILDGARRCFARHGFEGATVARLEAEIGLSRGAIFHYFEDKDALFIALAERDSRRRAALWREHGIAAIARAVQAEELDWMSVYPEMTRRLRTDPGFRARWEQRGEPLAQAMREAIEAGRREGRIRTDVSVDAVGQFLVTVFDGLLLENRLFELPPAPPDVVALVEDALRPRR